MVKKPSSTDALIASAMRMCRFEAQAVVFDVPVALRATDLEEELVAFGQLVLVELAPDYDPARGSFVTYARSHVRWAMLRFVYRGNVPEPVRLAHLHFHRDGRSQVADVDMNEAPREAHAKAVDWAKRELAALTAQWGFTSLPPDEQLEVHQQQARVRATIAAVHAEELGPEERWFVEQFYGRGEKFVALAKRLDCDERTIRRMRDRVEGIFERRFRAAGIDGAADEIDAS